MDPNTANGLATSRSAVHAIMYPPDAATCSTQTVNFKPASRSRVSCAAARPYPVTVPPPVLRTSTTSSPRLFFAERSTAVTSSRSAAACVARTSPKKLSTKTCGFSRDAARSAGSASGSRSPSHPGATRGSERSFARRARLCAGRAAATAWTYDASASARFAASFASRFSAPPESEKGNLDSDSGASDVSSSSSAAVSLAAARSSASSISSKFISRKSKSNSASSAASFLPPFDAFFTAAERMLRDTAAIFARRAASWRRHFPVALVTASRSATVSVPSVAAYFSANALRLRAATTDSLDTVAD